MSFPTSSTSSNLLLPTSTILQLTLVQTPNELNCIQESIPNSISTLQSTHSSVNDFNNNNSPKAVLTRNGASSRLPLSAMDELYSILPSTRGNPIAFWKAAHLTKKAARLSLLNEVTVGADDRPYGTIVIWGIEVRGLLDSGASISCLGKDAFETIQTLGIKPKSFKSTVQTAAGRDYPIVGYADAFICFAGQTKLIRLFLIPSLSQQLSIFGEHSGCYHLGLQKSPSNPPILQLNQTKTSISLTRLSNKCSTK